MHTPVLIRVKAYLPLYTCIIHIQLAKLIRLFIWDGAENLNSRILCLKFGKLEKIRFEMKSK